jgi:predicted metalloprotease with PDZ domain
MQRMNSEKMFITLKPQILMALVRIKQVEGDVYELPNHPDIVKISYTLFGNWTDGTYASIEPSHAHLNMPASFMWVLV